MTIAAIVPAYNEGAHIESVLRALCNSGFFTEVIVVDDGSEDNTAAVARKTCARVLRQVNQGKGAAMRKGALAAQADILFFADADLVHFTEEHVRLLVEPVLDGIAMMTVGLRDRGRLITRILPHIAPVLGGERAIHREIFLKISRVAPKDFGIETAMNDYCRVNNFSVRYVVLKGVSQVIKERKYGLWKGFSARCKMVYQIVRAEMHAINQRK